MEKELNYLSEKIEEFEVKVDRMEELLESWRYFLNAEDIKYTESQISKVIHEKEMLENILSSLTINALN